MKKDALNYTEGFLQTVSLAKNQINFYQKVFDEKNRRLVAIPLV